MVVTTSRFREIEATSPQNLNNLITALNSFQRFRFCPAEVSSDLKGTRPYDVWIEKTEIVIMHAWEITWNNPCYVVMKNTYEPIIPEGMANPEVLEIVKKSTLN